MRIGALGLVLSLAAACSRAPEDSARGAAAPASAASAPAPPASTSGSAAVPAGPAITVYKSPTCGCCTRWEEHLREAGFVVTSRPVDDLDAVKREHAISPEHQSCHTGVVDGYIVEGHVPASDIRRLLAERPDIRGIAVPGMPMGSPGMEGLFREAYEVITLEKNGAPSRVFARH